MCIREGMRKEREELGGKAGVYERLEQTRSSTGRLDT
jgi:hypothetical protein